MVLTHQSLSNEEKRVHERLLKLADSSENALTRAMDALLQSDPELARKVVEQDEAINQLYHQVEEQCFVTIALRQPVANDLRDLLASMQIAAELERIGDYAADIAATSLQMNKPIDDEHKQAFAAMAKRCTQMLARSMDIYRNPDEDAAKQLAAEDDQVDAAEQEIRTSLLEQMKAESATINDGMHAICIAHKLERTADRVTNIAERIVFAANGNVVELD